MSLCVSLHTLYYVPSYTLQGAWLLLGVRGSNVQKRPDQQHTHRNFAMPMMLLW